MSRGQRHDEDLRGEVRRLVEGARRELIRRRLERACRRSPEDQGKTGVERLVEIFERDGRL